MDVALHVSDGVPVMYPIGADRDRYRNVNQYVRPDGYFVTQRKRDGLSVGRSETSCPRRIEATASVQRSRL
jgi:hypothetical protein